MELHIDITDDLQIDRNRLSAGLRTYFANRPDITLRLRQFENAEQMLASYEPGKSDLVFLDICMGDVNGIELARHLRAVDEKVLIVFLTTSSEYAFDAFPIHPFDYLIKPYEESRLHEVLGEALRALSADEPVVSIRVPRSVHDVPLGKLCAVEARGHAVEVHLTDGQTLRSIMTFTEIENLLTADPRFLRCNRGILVNMDQVLRLDGDVFRMRDGTIFPLRVRSRAELVNKFSRYTIARMEGR